MQCSGDCCSYLWPTLRETHLLWSLCWLNAELTEILIQDHPSNTSNSDIQPTRKPRWDADRSGAVFGRLISSPCTCVGRDRIEIINHEMMNSKDQKCTYLHVCDIFQKKIPFFCNANRYAKNEPQAAAAMAFPPGLDPPDDPGAVCVASHIHPHPA